MNFGTTMTTFDFE